MTWTCVVTISPNLDDRPQRKPDDDKRVAKKYSKAGTKTTNQAMAGWVIVLAIIRRMRRTLLLLLLLDDDVVAVVMVMRQIFYFEFCIGSRFFFFWPCFEAITGISPEVLFVPARSCGGTLKHVSLTNP